MPLALAVCHWQWQPLYYLQLRLDQRRAVPVWHYFQVQVVIGGTRAAGVTVTVTRPLKPGVIRPGVGESVTKAAFWRTPRTHHWATGMLGHGAFGAPALNLLLN